VPAVKNNAITREKVELGKMLFFEPRLSSSHLISCNTCHNLSMGGDDNLETSIGHGWQKGPRNAPTVLNAVFNIAQFWDGRAEDLKAQAKGPVRGRCRNGQHA
jgi:Cytochrome c peroxidase